MISSPMLQTVVVCCLLSIPHALCFAPSSPSGKLGRPEGLVALASTVVKDELDTSVEVEFPPPLTKMERLQRAAQFWSSALPIVLSYYSKDAELRVKESFTGETLTEEEQEILWSEQHAQGARKLADTITSLKGFYVKTAQIIASRQDLFPPGMLSFDLFLLRSSLLLKSLTCDILTHSKSTRKP